MAGSAAALAISAGAVFGFAGAGRGGSTPFGYDEGFLRIAGAMWLRGESPYDPRAFDAAARALGHPLLGPIGFAYPPTVAPLAMVLGALPARAGALLLGGLNAAAAIAIVVLMIQLLPRGLSRRLDVRTFALVAVLGSPFTAHVLWMGQTTLLALVALLGGRVLGVGRGRTVLGGMLLAISTLKPQVVALPLAWVLLERRWKLASVAVVTSAVCAAPAALASGGPLAMARDWIGALAYYAAGPVQTASFRHVFGVRSLASSLGLNAGVPASLGLALVTVGAMALLWRGRERAGELGVMAVSLSLSVLLVYAHDYDLVALSPLFLFVWIETEDARPQTAWLFLLAMGLLFLPQRFVRAAGAGPDDVLLHWRELVLLAIVVPALAHLSRAKSPEPLPMTTEGENMRV